MSALRKHLEDYLALRRGLGFRLGRAGQILEGFVSDLESLFNGLCERVQVIPV